MLTAWRRAADTATWVNKGGTHEATACLPTHRHITPLPHTTPIPSVAQVEKAYEDTGRLPRALMKTEANFLQGPDSQGPRKEAKTAPITALVTLFIPRCSKPSGRKAPPRPYIIQANIQTSQYGTSVGPVTGLKPVTSPVPLHSKSSGLSA